MPNKKKIVQLIMIYVPLVGFTVLGFMASWQFTLVFIGIVVFVIGLVSWVNDNL